MNFVTPPRLAMLRARTRAAHAAIESVPALGRLLAPDLTVAEYIAVLDAMHGFHRAFEPGIAEALRDVPGARAVLGQSRLPALAADLDWFGVAPSPGLPAVPRLRSAAAGIGALYVVEGSILGGRVIARYLGVSLDVRSAEGASYYGGLSADAARARWQMLCDLVETGCADGAEANEAMAEAACATFDSLDRWMRRLSAARSVRPMAEAAAS